MHQGFINKYVYILKIGVVQMHLCLLVVCAFKYSKMRMMNALPNRCYYCGHIDITLVFTICCKIPHVTVPVSRPIAGGML